MTALSTLADIASEAYLANVAHNSKLVGELRHQIAVASLGGSTASRERHVARGKLLPRDRVQPFARSRLSVSGSRRFGGDRHV